MQERYLGDSHDFLKYALLRSLHRALNLKLGVNWYLTCPSAVDRPGNNDGEKRHHLSGGAWEAIAPELLSQIAHFADPKLRRLDTVASLGILPEGTLYFQETVPVTDRQAWLSRSLQLFEDRDLIFLDPDNGFEIKSMTRRSAPKYALYHEAAAVTRAGKALVGIQFARQCDPIRGAHEVRSELSRHCEGGVPLTVMRGRVAPNILFFTVSPTHMAKSLTDAIEDLANRSSKIELID